MLHHDIWLIGLFCSLEFLQFFKSVLFKFAEKSDGERVKLSYFNLLCLGPEEKKD